MREAGLAVREDALGNLIGRLEASRPGAKTLVLGSHLDTVSDAGRFDGALGVLLPIVALRHLRREGVRLPFALEVVGFSEEEGVRFPSAYLGSRDTPAAFGRPTSRLGMKMESPSASACASGLTLAGGGPGSGPRARIRPASSWATWRSTSNRAPCSRSAASPAALFRPSPGRRERGWNSSAARATPEQRRWRCGATHSRAGPSSSWPRNRSRGSALRSSRRSAGSRRAPVPEM